MLMTKMVTACFSRQTGQSGFQKQQGWFGKTVELVSEGGQAGFCKFE
jgi:hypothetical protein